jgi:hypothetical protein
MKNYLTSSKRKRSILLLGVFSFVLHALTPYFHPAMAGTTGGYKQTICTVNGSKTIFVALEDNQQQNLPDCFECPSCIVQANANGWLAAQSPFVEPHFILHQSARNDPFYRAPTEPFFANFLSRAPPL